MPRLRFFSTAIDHNGRRTIAAAAVLLGWMTSLCGQVPYEAGDWPQWRGPQRTGVSLEQGLLAEWPAAGPPSAWSVTDVGVGYSSLAVRGGRIFTMGDLDGIEHVIAIDLETGRRIWAVQPAPVAEALRAKVDKEFTRLDRDADGAVDEAESLRGFGWEFNQFDKPVDGDAAPRLQARAAAVFAALDADRDGRLTFGEAGAALRDRFERFDQQDPSADAARLAHDRAAALVAAADKDGDGTITRQEARGTDVDRLLGRADRRDAATNKGDELLTAEELTDYLHRSEPGRDGWLTAEELSAAYARERPPGDGRLSVAEVRFHVGGYRNAFGHGPRCTPTVDGDRVYVEGGFGDVSCLNAADGTTRWHVNLVRDFGGGLPGWGYSESPLVVGDVVVVTPGGAKGSLLALDKLTGRQVWRSDGVVEAAQYSSPVLAELGGLRQVVQFGNKSVYGVALDTGRLQWSYPAPASQNVNCCTPIVDDGFVFASSSYGTGGGLARIAVSGTAQQAEEVYFEKKMACHHGGMVKLGEYLYSNAGGPLMCMHFKTGAIAWQNRSVGKGSLVAADGMLYVLGEGHAVALVEATPEAYREHGRFTIEAHGRPSWTHPVVAHGRLLLRDQWVLTAYDVRAKR